MCYGPPKYGLLTTGALHLIYGRRQIKGFWFRFVYRKHNNHHRFYLYYAVWPPLLGLEGNRCFRSSWMWNMSKIIRFSNEILKGKNVSLICSIYNDCDMVTLNQKVFGRVLVEIRTWKCCALSSLRVFSWLYSFIAFCFAYFNWPPFDSPN